MFDIFAGQKQKLIDWSTKCYAPMSPPSIPKGVSMLHVNTHVSMVTNTHLAQVAEQPRFTKYF